MKASKVLVLVSKDQGVKNNIPTHVEVWLNCSDGFACTVLEGHEDGHKTLWLTHHLRHRLLVKGEGDVGTAVVLVTGAGVAFAGRRGEVGAFAKARTRLHEAVALPDGDAGLA